MQCSKDEFVAVLATWRDKTCAVHLHTDEVNGTFLAVFRASSADALLEFSSHPLLEPMTINLANASEFEFGVPEQEAPAAESQLVKDVADEMMLARVEGKLVFSMTRLIDPFAGTLIPR